MKKLECPTWVNNYDVTHFDLPNINVLQGTCPDSFKNDVVNAIGEVQMMINDREILKLDECLIWYIGDKFDNIYH